MNSPGFITKQQGMTLLELLIAVALMSVIAVMAFAGIFTLTTAHQQMDDTVHRLNRDNAALSLFQQDIKMALGQRLTAQPATTSGFTGDTGSVRLQRFNPAQAIPRQGMVNPVKQHPATVLSVRWFVRDRTWYRATRAAVSTDYAAWQEQPMMPLENIRCQYQAVGGGLLDRWPSREAPVGDLPVAVHCRITSEYNRLYELTLTPWQQIW